MKRRVVVPRVVALAAAPRSPASTAPTGLSIGSWNVHLTPFLGGQQAVVDEVAASGFKVLSLRGVWSQSAEDALLADPRIAAHYPYH